MLALQRCGYPTGRTDPQMPVQEKRTALSSFELLLLLAAVVGARLLTARVSHVYDDAFITYRYALNFASGNGLMFNPGESWEPVLGTTSPGYAVLLAAFLKMGAEAVRASFVLNIACDVVSAGLLVALLGRERLRCTLAVLAFACFPLLGRIAVGGMEAPVLCCTALAATWSLTRGRWVLAGVLSGLACTLRPEAVLLVLIAFWYARKTRRSLLQVVVPVAVIGVLYAAALTAFYGHPIPQSVLSKAERHGDSPIIATLWEILSQAFVLDPLPLAALLPWVLFGLARALRDRTSTLRPFHIFALAIVCAYLAARPHTWGWYFYVPLVAWTVWLAYGIEPLVRACLRPVPVLDRWMPALLVGIALGGVGAVSFKLNNHVNERVYQPMAAWAESVQLAESGDLILASDIGAIGYYGAGRVLDSEGLTWPAAVDFANQGDIAAEFRPRYLLVTAVRKKLEPLRRHPIYAKYRPVARFSALGHTDLEPALDDLASSWQQDYIVFELR